MRYFLWRRRSVCATIQGRSRLRYAGCPIPELQVAENRVTVHVGRREGDRDSLGWLVQPKESKNEMWLLHQLEWGKEVNFKEGTGLSEAK